MANQQNPNQPRPADGAGQQPRKHEQGGQQSGRPTSPNRPGDAGTRRDPGSTPGSKPDPYRHPGDEPDIKPDVTAGQGQPAKGGDKPRYGNTGGNRTGVQEESK